MSNWQYVTSSLSSYFHVSANVILIPLAFSVVTSAVTSSPCRLLLTGAKNQTVAALKLTCPEDLRFFALTSKCETADANCQSKLSLPGSGCQRLFRERNETFNHSPWSTAAGPCFRLFEGRSIGQKICLKFKQPFLCKYFSPTQGFSIFKTFQLKWILRKSIEFMICHTTGTPKLISE